MNPRGYDEAAVVRAVEHWVEGQQLAAVESVEEPCS